MASAGCWNQQTTPYLRLQHIVVDLSEVGSVSQQFYKSTNLVLIIILITMEHTHTRIATELT